MWPSIAACSTSGGGGGASSHLARAVHQARHPGEALLDPLGRGDVLAHAELLRLEAERQADELRQVQDREAEVAVDDLGRLGLLHVEVEVAERAGGDQAVGAGVERVADVGAGLAQRGLAVHRDHREAAALAGAVVLDDLAAERLDHLLQVEVALGVLVVAEPVLGPDDVAAVEGADAQAGERPLDLRLQLRRGRSPRPAARGSSCSSKPVLVLRRTRAPRRRAPR